MNKYSVELKFSLIQNIWIRKLWALVSHHRAGKQGVTWTTRKRVLQGGKLRTTAHKPLFCCQPQSLVLSQSSKNSEKLLTTSLFSFATPKTSQGVQVSYTPKLDVGRLNSDSLLAVFALSDLGIAFTNTGLIFFFRYSLIQFNAEKSITWWTLSLSSEVKFVIRYNLRDLLIWSEALMIISIHEYNRYIHEYLYLFIKFKDFIVTSPVLWNFL
jgi:hypothetical protein